jgi:CHAT domain-containing protein
MACALAVAEQPAEARQFFEMAMTSLQKIRRSIDRVDFNISYYGSVQEVFDRAIQFFAQESRDWRAAFHAMERAKAQSVLDLLNQPRLFFRQFSVEGGAISPDSVRAALSPRMALVEYRVSPNFLWIACLTKDRLTLRSQSIQSSTLDSLVKAYRRSIGADDYEAFAEKAESDPALAFHESSRLSQELFNIVLAPVADVLHGVEQIVFVADGSLSYLPFATLKAPQQQQNEFLIHQWNISYIPSATIWYILTTRTSLAPAAIPSRMMMKEKSEIKALLLALDSPSIPFARKEVLRLAEILPNAEPRTAQVFSKSELKNQLKFKWDFLHFATHARVRDDQPLFSHLALSNDEQNPEQQLFLSDILPFDFSQTKLVTLSACETALGRVTSGEGMLGLTQAFLCAGAPALLTSLWQVDDEQTQQLMIDFYRHYLHPSMSATAALRQAQLAMIKNLSSGMVKFPFPYFWAPFILTGQSRLASL